MFLSNISELQDYIPSHPRRLVLFAVITLWISNWKCSRLFTLLSSTSLIHTCVILNRLDNFTSYHWMLLTSRCHSFEVFKEGSCLCRPSDTVLIILHSISVLRALQQNFNRWLHSSYTLPLVIFYIVFLIFKPETCVLKHMIKRTNRVSP